MLSGEAQGVIREGVGVGLAEVKCRIEGQDRRECLHIASWRTKEEENQSNEKTIPVSVLPCAFLSFFRCQTINSSVCTPNDSTIRQSFLPTIFLSSPPLYLHHHDHHNYR